MARSSSKARRHPKARPQGVLDLSVRGYGFVKTAEGEFFVPASATNGAFPGDFVEVAPLSPDRSAHGAPGARKPSARVSKVLMRAHDTFIGRYEVADPFGVVVPEDPRIHHDIFTLRRDAPDVCDGDMVEVRIVEFPSRHSTATGQIVRVLGKDEDADVTVDLIVADHRFETEFSAAALEQARSCALDIVGALAQGYRDLRDAFVFTVDPVDARDFDDAVSIEREGDCMRLGVHIADVSRFVAYGSSIDLDARRRATSIYLVDRVIPMLPERLSNDLCSLVPAAPRCTLSVEALVDSNGAVRSFEVFPAVIESVARLSYDQAQALLDADEGSDARAVLGSCDVPAGATPVGADVAEGVAWRLRALGALARGQFERRRRAGCIDFERDEVKAVLDATGRPVGVLHRRSTPATELIEEAMILANRLVAEWLEGRGLPCVHRVHDEPDGDALAALYEVLQESPVFKDVDRRLFCAGEPHTLQGVLERARDLPQRELVNELMLRAMKRAVYRVEPGVHYGLALDTYCHFTSPIRRYPDLLVHRMVKEGLLGHTATYEAQRHELPWMAEHASHQEREADAAARESHLSKIVEYLQAFVGESFEGVISHVSTFGVTVRLENSVAGMVPVEELGDEYFSFDPRRHQLSGSATGRVFRLGQALRVVLVEAFPRERRLAFRLDASEREGFVRRAH